MVSIPGLGAAISKGLATQKAEAKKDESITRSVPERLSASDRILRQQSPVERAVGNSAQQFQYTGPGSSPGTGGLPTESTERSVGDSVKQFEYTGPGSSPGTGGLLEDSNEFEYTGPGSSPGTGGLPSNADLFEYTGPGSSPATGGLPEVSDVVPTDGPSQSEIDELDADVNEFIEQSDAIFAGGPLSVEDAQNFETELAEFLGVDSIVDQQALSELKDEDFASNGVDGLVSELSPEAQTRLTALVLGLGPQRIEAMIQLTDIGLRAEPANDGDTSKSAISFKDYLGGSLPVSLLAGRQVEIDEFIAQDGNALFDAAATGATVTSATVSAADAAFKIFPPAASSTGLVNTAQVVAGKGLGRVLFVASALPVAKEIIDGEFFNSGNDTLEAISVTAGGIALVPGPWQIPALGVSAVSGIGSLFVSETDLVDRPVDELFSALDEQLTGLEDELTQLREDSSADVDFAVGQQLGQETGPPVPLNAADQEILDRRLVLEAQLGAPTDAELATAGLNRDRTNELIDFVSLNKVLNRLYERAAAETWNPLFPQTIEVRDQRSDKIYRAIVPEHIQTDPFLLGPDLINDINSAIEDVESIDAEIARLEQQNE